MHQDQAALPIVGALLLLVIYIARSMLTKSEDVSKKIPWVGREDGFMSDIKARIKSLKSSALEVSDAGYQKFSKSGSVFMLPGFDAHSVIIPSTEIKWLIDQPNRVTIKRDITRVIGGLIPEIEDELNVAIDKYWGLDTENWNEVVLMETVRKMVTRTSNRVFVGLPLCRDEEFIDYCCNYTEAIALSGNLVNPYHLNGANKQMLPLLAERRKRIEQVRDKGMATIPWNDFSFWYMREVLKNPAPKERTLEMISKRVMATNFAAIHTSTFTATNIFIDLYSSPRVDDFVAGLRDEITSVLAENGDKWDKFAVPKLVRVDRLYRLVVDPNGVTMDSGLHLPQGTRVGVNSYSIHHDENNHNNAGTYDAFRFSQEQEESVDILKAKNLAGVTTSDTFLSFGHGRHACPGRFFATTEMKLLLAYVVMNYDVKPLMERPQGFVSGGFRFPPSKTTLSVRRRALQ